jgi:excisionase family DNA binding protein
MSEEIIARLLTVPQLGEYINLKAGTIYNRISEGKFPIKPVRFTTGKKAAIRFDKKAVDAWIEAQNE